jgi:hypothetical protein
MGWVWDLLRIRSAFTLDVAAPLADVVYRLRSRVLPTPPSALGREFHLSFRLVRPSALTERQGYAGEVTDRGFALRRFGRALRRGETRPAVDVRGEFRPDGDWTRVVVVLRHGWLLVSFGWLLLVLEVAALIGARSDGRPGKMSPVVGAAMFTALVALWYLGLWRDIRRVRREIVALVTDEAG